MVDLFLILFSWAKKYLFYLIIFILVLIGIAIFSFYLKKLPFFRRSPRIAQTAVSVKEITEIGQLMTAQYYGEVFVSLRNVTYEKLDDKADAAFQKVKRIFALLVKRTLPGHSIDRIENDKRLYQKLKYKLNKNSHYKKLILTSRYRLLKRAGGQRDDLKFLFYLHNTELEQFRAVYGVKIDQLLKAYQSKALNSADISYIGRGWTKAGYNLKELSEKNMFVQDNTLYLDLNPVVFTDINPWFIPELGIKGFEIVTSNRANTLSFEQITMVKMQCKQKLEDDAIKRGLLERAKENAEQSLGQLIKMLDQNGTIQSVVIGVAEQE